MEYPWRVAHLEPASGSLSFPLNDFRRGSRKRIRCLHLWHDWHAAGREVDVAKCWKELANQKPTKQDSCYFFLLLNPPLPSVSLPSFNFLRLVLRCLVVPCFVLSRIVLFCFALHRLALPCFASLCSVNVTVFTYLRDHRVVVRHLTCVASDVIRKLKQRQKHHINICIII